MRKVTGQIHSFLPRLGGIFNENWRKKHISVIILLGVLILLSISLFIMYRIHRTIQKEEFDNNRKELHKKIDAIYYINLNKREDRNKDFLENFNEIDEKRIIRIPAHYYPENGHVGCLMSHINALSRAIKDNLGENILICEDDFTIKDMDYCNRMLQLQFEKFPNWDVILLCHHTFNSNDTGVETPNHEKIIKILDAQNTGGYLIKKRYIPRLLDMYTNNLLKYVKTGDWGDFSYNVDQSWKKLQPNDEWYGFSPPVSVQRASYSDIERINVEVDV
jgi:GR25 family glycosyltransferase involved in LPS biosynthesis